jgi:hypothetical protein
MLSKHRLTLNCAVLGLSLLLSVSVAGQNRRERFDPDGDFWILGQPDDFSDLGGITLNAKRLRHLGKPGVYQGNSRHFSFKTLSVRQDKFVFTTVTVRGVSYSFAGKFLRGGNYQRAMLDDETPVLEGRLQKFVSGKKVAEAQLKFMYFGGT